MKNSLETRLGIFVILCLFAAFLIMHLVGGLDFLKPGYRLGALFANIHELKEGDPVKMAGVEIGRVQDIALTEGKVKVMMKIKPGAEIKTDSIASVQFSGLMGQNFVAIEFGSPSAPRHDPNSFLLTKEQPDLTAIMQKLDNVAGGVENLVKSIPGDTINNLFGPLTDMIKQNQVPLTAMIANLRAVSAQFVEGKGSIGKLIQDETLYNTSLATMKNMEKATEEIQSTLAQARTLVDKVNAGQGSIGKLLTDETLYRETTASMTTLKEILQKINMGQGSVGKLVNDEALYKNLKLSLQKLDKATEGLEDQGPLTVLGMAVNSLF